MADLDDFFAKKDRKKKAVKKFATADELAKKLEDTKQKTDVRPKKERPVQEGEEGGRAGEEEEWKEYEEPVKDYTGLKIQVLQGGNGAPESGGRSESEDSAPDGSGKGKGPWNKPVEVEPPPPPPPVEEPSRREVKPAAYVAPAQRNRPVEPLRRHQAEPPRREVKPAADVAPAQRNRPVEPLRRHQVKHAPDIHNDDTFPVLGAGPGAKRGGWSTAGASPAPAHHARQPLALGNRFTTLQDDS